MAEEVVEVKEAPVADVVKETPAPVKEEGKVFLSDFDDDAPIKDKDGKVTPVAEATKLNFSRFKEVDEDIDDEDKAIGRLRAYKEENANLKIVAKGNRVINEDKDIRDWNSLLQLKDEELVKEGLVFSFQQAGYDEATAKKKAEDKIAKATDLENDFIEEEAVKLRGQLRSSINGKATELQKQIADAESALPKESKKEQETLYTTVREKIQGKENFLGLELGGDAESIKKIRGKAEKLMSDDKFQKLLKDPEFIADALFLYANKAGLEKAIKERSSSTRASMLDKIDKAVPVNRPQFANRTAQQTNTQKAFNPAKFR